MPGPPPPLSASRLVGTIGKKIANTSDRKSKQNNFFIRLEKKRLTYEYGEKHDVPIKRVPAAKSPDVTLRW